MLGSALLALPTLVDMRVPDLSELVLGGMSQLEAATVHAAAAAAEREDTAMEAGGGSGGGSGSGDGGGGDDGDDTVATVAVRGGRFNTGAGLVNYGTSSWPRGTTLGRGGMGSALVPQLLPLSLSPVPLLSRVPALAALRQAGWASPAPVPAAAAADRGAVYQRGLVSAARNVQASFAASTYSQQEAAAREFTAWLARFGGGRTVLDCTPDDVLVYIAKHWLPCHSSRQTEASGPSAFKSHPLLLSGALARAGRDGRYDAVTGEGNPWPSAWVEDCRKGYRRQQMLAGYQEVSAVPLLAAQKYEAGVRHVWGSTHSAAGSLAVLVLLRDLLCVLAPARHTPRLVLPVPACLHRITRLTVAPRSLLRFAM